MPTGKVRFFDESRGFGFIAGEDGSDVFLHASALPAGVEGPRPGTKVEYDVADGKRGPSALAVRIVAVPPSVAKAKSHRKKPEDMVVIIEDLIKVLDETSNSLRRGRYPERRSASKVAGLLRAVAGDLEA